MRLICLTLLFNFYVISYSDDLEKYRVHREQCSRTPLNSECSQIKSKFLQLIQKCQKIQTGEQFLLCQQVKAKFCAIFPSTCTQSSTITPRSTKRRTSTKPKPVTTTTTTAKAKVTTHERINNEEFIKVPVNPDELRIRGEYCIRHGKEKKCQQLLNNLKKTYSSCSKKKVETTPTKPEEIDCHSFQTHLCKAFPKFPPCLKKLPKSN